MKISYYIFRAKIRAIGNVRNFIDDIIGIPDFTSIEFRASYSRTQYSASFFKWSTNSNQTKKLGSHLNVFEYNSKILLTNTKIFNMMRNKIIYFDFASYEYFFFKLSTFLKQRSIAWMLLIRILSFFKFQNYLRSHKKKLLLVFFCPLFLVDKVTYFLFFPLCAAYW